MIILSLHRLALYQRQIFDRSQHQHFFHVARIAFVGIIPIGFVVDEFVIGKEIAADIVGICFGIIKPSEAIAVNKLLEGFIDEI